jgi:hypothetical protein
LGSFATAGSAQRHGRNFSGASYRSARRWTTPGEIVDGGPAIVEHLAQLAHHLGLGAMYETAGVGLLRVTVDRNV